MILLRIFFMVIFLFSSILSDTSDDVALSFAVDPKKFWEDGIVAYEVDEEFSEEQKGKIGDAMNYITSRLYPGCIQFKPRSPSDEYYVSFLRDEVECSSTIGRDLENGNSKIKLMDACFESPGTVLHEIVHTLGAVHEHIRPDRNLFVEVDCDRLSRDTKAYFTRKEKKFGKTSSTTYDVKSVMHYRKKEIELASDDPNDIVLKLREEYASLSDLSEIPPLELTPTDIVEISRNYDCLLKPGVKESYIEYVTKITNALVKHIENCLSGLSETEPIACINGYKVANEYFDEWKELDAQSKDYKNARKMFEDITAAAERSNNIFKEEEKTGGQCP